MSVPNKAASPDRRSFFKKALATVIGGILMLPPAIAGLMVMFDPLRRKAGSVGSIKVAALDALPNDGVPRKFSVLADKVDAWNKAKNVPIGAVYLRRTGETQVEALNVVCPHAGCFVDFSADRSKFICPCHLSSFEANGQIADKSSPSPRALDSLPVEVRPDGTIWVTFQNFEAGRTDKVPVA
jgi:menaquinol-cytochrome c reductase iron-sulfur subunit